MSSHPSERPTWTSAGNLRTVLLGLASGGVCLAAASPRRRCALTAPFQPCRPTAARAGRELGRCVFCGTFPRVSPGRRYRPPCPSMSGLSSESHLRGCLACPSRVGLAGRRLNSGSAAALEVPAHVALVVGLHDVDGAGGAIGGGHLALEPIALLDRTVLGTA